MSVDRILRIESAVSFSWQFEDSRRQLQVPRDHENGKRGFDDSRAVVKEGRLE